jgi:hypothetical protein
LNTGEMVPPFQPIETLIGAPSGGSGSWPYESSSSMLHSSNSSLLSMQTTLRRYGRSRAVTSSPATMILRWAC